MTHNRYFWRTVIVLAMPCLPVAAETANSRFDGNWAVEAYAEAGTCTGPYQFPIVIKDGVVNEAAKFGADAEGRTDADGKITGTIRQGLANVAVSGLLEGSNGSGRWTLSGLSTCTGHWKARKVG